MPECVVIVRRLGYGGSVESEGWLTEYGRWLGSGTGGGCEGRW
jgi:hypothetical protein